MRKLYYINIDMVSKYHLNKLKNKYNSTSHCSTSDHPFRDSKISLEEIASRPSHLQRKKCEQLHHFLFELRAINPNESFVPWLSVKSAELVKKLRNQAANHLKKRLTKQNQTIDRVLIGRGATDTDKESRVRILPLPSIDHHHAPDGSIRCVWIGVPPKCPLRANDIAWAFTGIKNIDYKTGKILWNLVETDDQNILKHYGIGKNGDAENSFHAWRTVIPVVLPSMKLKQQQSNEVNKVADGSIEIIGKNKPVAGDEDMELACAMKQALRHAGVFTPLKSILVQRESFDLNNVPSKKFIAPERLAMNDLYHTEITFEHGVTGPLVIGNGRYFGLGLMAPVVSMSPVAPKNDKNTYSDVLTFSINSNVSICNSNVSFFLRSVRRALMSLSRDYSGQVTQLFSGHEPKQNKAPLKSNGHQHIFLAADDTDRDGFMDRLIVAAPWACDQTTKGSRENHDCFNKVVRNLIHVRAGKLGIISLKPTFFHKNSDQLAKSSHIWKSYNFYRTTRHAGRGKNVRMAAINDIIMECERRGLPKPHVKIIEVKFVPNGGRLIARMRLYFSVEVEGPLMLGRDSHMGGGIFISVTKKEHCDV